YKRDHRRALSGRLRTAAIEGRADKDDRLCGATAEPRPGAGRRAVGDPELEGVHVQSLTKPATGERPRSQVLLGNARPRGSASRARFPGGQFGSLSGVGAAKRSFWASRSQAELGNEDLWGEKRRVPPSGRLRCSTLSDADRGPVTASAGGPSSRWAAWHWAGSASPRCCGSAPSPGRRVAARRGGQ